MLEFAQWIDADGGWRWLGTVSVNIAAGNEQAAGSLIIAHDKSGG